MHTVTKLLQSTVIAVINRVCYTDPNIELELIQLLRRIKLQGTENTRDLGGYPTKNGAMTRYGMFLRSGVPNGLTPDDVEKLKNMGITTIIDLRSQPELDRTPCHLSNADGFDYYNFSVITDDFMSAGEQAIPISYFNMCKGPHMPTVFQILADMPGGALYHCTAGKDRTGTISAILLMLAEVEKPDIIADYIITYPHLTNLIRSLRNDHPDIPAYVGRSNPEYMEEFLRLFEQEYGTAENYLQTIGLTSDSIQRLKAKLLSV